MAGGGPARWLVLCIVTVLAAQALRADASSVQDRLSVLATVAVGDGPRALALDRSTRRIYVANENSASLTVVDTAAGSAVSDLALVGGVGGAQLVAVDASLQRAFVVVGPRSGPHAVIALDAHDGRHLGTISTDLWIVGIAADARLGRLFITGVRANASVGIPYLVVVQSADLQIELSRFMGVNDSAGISNPLLDECRGHVYLLETVRILDPNLNIYDAATLSPVGGRTVSIGLATRMSGFALDVLRRRVAATWLNEARRTEYLTFLGTGLRVDLPSAGPVAVDQRTGIVYVASRVDIFDTRGDRQPPIGRLTAVDLDNRTIVDSVELGRGPHALAIDEATSRVYVTNFADGTLSIVKGVEPPPGTPIPSCDDIADPSPFW